MPVSRSALKSKAAIRIKSSRLTGMFARSPATLPGLRSNLDRFKETLSTSAPIVIELDARQTGPEFIPSLDNLRGNPQFRDAGVTVLKCDPAGLPVYVDSLEKRSVPVKLPPDVSGTQAVFDPPTVTVTGPSRFVKSFNEVTADTSALQELNTPGVHPPVNVSLQPDPSGYLTYEPSQVKAVLTVAQTDVTRTFTVPDLAGDAAGDQQKI